jgi:hypothetical protein
MKRGNKHNGSARPAPAGLRLCLHCMQVHVCMVVTKRKFIPSPPTRVTVAGQGDVIPSFDRTSNLQREANQMSVASQETGLVHLIQRYAYPLEARMNSGRGPVLAGRSRQRRRRDKIEMTRNETPHQSNGLHFILQDRKPKTRHKPIITGFESKKYRASC